MIPIKNETRFAQHYIDANERLMDAIAEPNQFAFDHTFTAAVLAVSSSFDTIELALGQKLAQNVIDTAQKFGYKVV